MDRKIITLLIVLFISVGMVWAENNTSDAVEADDDINYIMPVSISENGIEFSDGFIGFSLDGSKLTANDGFIPEPTGNDELQNYIKLAIIECFKQSREDDLGKVVASFCDGSYKNSNDEVITAVLDSSDKIKDSAFVELDDSSEATFDFELLKSSEDKSDCLAYHVSVKAAPQKATLGAADSASEDVSDNDSAQETGPDDDAKESEPAQSDDKDTKEKSEPVAAGGTEADDNDTKINETNKTIINKTNTVIVNEKNTTIITKNNVKNDTPQDTILKTAGNPLFILAVVAIILIAVVAYSKYKKG